MIGRWLCRHNLHAWRQRLTWNQAGKVGWWQCKRCGQVIR